MSCAIVKNQHCKRLEVSIQGECVSPKLVCPLPYPHGFNFLLSLIIAALQVFVNFFYRLEILLQMALSL